MKIIRLYSLFLSQIFSKDQIRLKLFLFLLISNFSIHFFLIQAQVRKSEKNDIQLSRIEYSLSFYSSENKNNSEHLLLNIILRKVKDQDKEKTWSWTMNGLQLSEKLNLSETNRSKIKNFEDTLSQFIENYPNSWVSAEEYKRKNDIENERIIQTGKPRDLKGYYELVIETSGKVYYQLEVLDQSSNKIIPIPNTNIKASTQSWNPHYGFLHKLFSELSSLNTQ
jgi:hypothetical protein